MSIIFQTTDQFYNGIKQLVERGILFEADHDKLIIKLSGGF